MWGTGCSPGEVPISIIHSTLLCGGQFGATLSLNSKQFREKSGQILVMWGYVNVRDSSANKVPWAREACGMVAGFSGG